MDYLALVNKVIQESASELDELTSGTWDSAEAGRRIYPRIKRNVAQAWKEIQMRRPSWEFMASEFSAVIYPRLTIKDAARAAGTPSVGAVFEGDESGFQFTVRDVLTTGDWDDGEIAGMLEFEDYEGTRPIPGETFTEVSPVVGDGTFTYVGKGNYDFLDVDPYLREIQWATFVANNVDSPVAMTPVRYVPWDNWAYKEYTFTTSALYVPNYVSQDFEGSVVFYPQTFTPFRINFIYKLAPQDLVEDDDVPSRLPEEYHEWIAWEALMNYAMFDKNPDLYAYANKHADFYMRRAERELMPLLSYRDNAFNV